MIFAPVTVSKDLAPTLRESNKFHRKFVVNLGWIPKTSKHMIKTTTASDIIGENDYSEDPIAARKLNLIKGDNLGRAPFFEDLYMPISTITAYVRKGEQ